MTVFTISGLLLITGFILVLAATFSGPPRLYQESESGVRLEIIARNGWRWVLSNLLFIGGGVATAVGLIFLSSAAVGSVNPLLAWGAALAYGAGTILWVYFLLKRTIDPAQLFENYHFSALETALIAFLIVGLVLYGLVFLQAGMAAWLGISTAGLSLLIGILALVMPDRFFASFPPQIFYFFTLAAGIVLLTS